MTTPRPARTLPYPDTSAVAAFMRAFGQPVRTTPTAEITEAERLLRVRLIVEEALEFAEAMGCIVSAPADSDGLLAPKHVDVTLDEFTGIDLVEATDALADLTVVVKGSAHTLGVDLDSAFIAVHETNMAKLGPNGEVIRDQYGKIRKPANWQPPTEAIEALLVDSGWTPGDA